MVILYTKYYHDFSEFYVRFQEDLTVDDMNNILNELKAGKVPKAGPRFVLQFKD